MQVGLKLHTHIQKEQHAKVKSTQMNFFKFTTSAQEQMLILINTQILYYIQALINI